MGGGFRNVALSNIAFVSAELKCCGEFKAMGARGLFFHPFSTKDQRCIHTALIPRAVVLASPGRLY